VSLSRNGGYLAIGDQDGKVKTFKLLDFEKHFDPK